jgi:copper oxidase (laccase) domain-containing protein
MSFRYGDAAEVAANRAAFLQAGGVDDARIVVMEVAHGDNVVRVGETEAGSARESERVIRAEALMTDELGVGLFLLTADCLPVTFHDSMHGAAALAHIGWKPSVLGLAGKVVREMRAAFGGAQARRRLVRLSRCHGEVACRSRRRDRGTACRGMRPARAHHYRFD